MLSSVIKFKDHFVWINRVAVEKILKKYRKAFADDAIAHDLNVAKENYGFWMGTSGMQKLVDDLNEIVADITKHIIRRTSDGGF